MPEFRNGNSLIFPEKMEGTDMSRVATSGTFSCVAMSVHGFSDKDEAMNRAYINQVDNGGTLWSKVQSPKPGGVSVGNFYEKVLYPVEQPQGKSVDLPFRMLMEQIDKNHMREKIIFAILNDRQHNGYWQNELKFHGFEHTQSAFNQIGQVCHLYIRSFNQVDEDNNWLNENNSNHAPVGYNIYGEEWGENE